jgi:hypothetical protein
MENYVQLTLDDALDAYYDELIAALEALCIDNGWVV